MVASIRTILLLFSGILAHEIKAQEFEITPDIFSSRSPSGLLLEFIGMKPEDSILKEVLELLPSAAQTDYGSSPDSPTSSGFNCNLNDVNPVCFMTEIAGKLGEPWNQSEEDELRAKSVINDVLVSPNLIKEAAVLTCITAPVYIRLFSILGYDAGSPDETINSAKAACLENHVVKSR